MRRSKLALPVWLVACGASATASQSAPRTDVVLVADAPETVPVQQQTPHGKPVAVVDLATTDGAALVGVAWRWQDAAIVAARGQAVGVDLRASGAEIETRDLTPLVGEPAFERGWTDIAPEDLIVRRGAGKLSFGWYRTRIAIPETIGDTPTRGTTIALEIVVDDHAEVWVDGELEADLGGVGGQLVAGFNAPNRVVLTRDARPEQSFDVAVFAMNGPVSTTPDNFLWVRSATLDVYAQLHAPDVRPELGRVERLDPRLDALVATDARIEKIAGGFEFTEGPVWHDGRKSLVFSDPNLNTIFEWTDDFGVRVLRTKSGYAGVDIGRYRQPGSNGLALDAEGRLTIDEHGRRRVVRIERTGAITVLADRFEGRRLNSPNDLVYRSDGSLYFTDPPFGLPGTFDDPAKELDFSGVYRVERPGEVELVTRELSAPNGLAFSPDERTLYVDNWDPERKVVLAFPVADDGTLGPGRVLLDLTAMEGDECFDGIEVDALGNVWVAGPEGVYIVSEGGDVLGLIRMGEKAANLAWGDADKRTLYLAAHSGVYRLRTEVEGHVTRF
jgi:gluconolactonase